MTFNRRLDSCMIAGLLCPLVVCGAVSQVHADFDGNTIGGEWYWPDLDSVVDSFEAVVDPVVPEYFYNIDGNPFDGYFINFAGSSVLFGFSTADFEMRKQSGTSRKRLAPPAVAPTTARAIWFCLSSGFSRRARAASRRTSRPDMGFAMTPTVPTRAEGD